MCSDSPISATLVAWGNAWLGGHVGLDEAVDRVERAGGPQLVATAAPAADHRHDPSAPPPVPGVAPPGAEVPLRAFLAELRPHGLRALRLALPVPGDPLGLTGPAAFNAGAIDAGEAAIAELADGCVGLIPAPDVRGSSYAGVRWSAMTAAVAVPDLPTLGEAERELHEAMRSATEALSSVHGPAGERPTLRHGEGLAPGYPPRAHRVAALCSRLAAILDAADDRGLTAGQIAARSQALRDLDRAVRRARLACHHAHGIR
ncbi:hypothetical protein AB0K60_26965 [Thermopolyspora sp. NPDC052614]|uniref:hypothetical protein n=1 Tax=Thermopolyspora sp. NPDC052614 TaxID=3155682 RepID=UPI00341AB3DF